MVSNARLDLPEPESPVTTTSLSRGISSEMFLRLWTRAPCTAMVVRGDGFALDGLLPAVDLAAISSPLDVEEGQLLHLDVAPPGELHRRRGLADQPLIGEVLTGRRDATKVEVPLEMVLDLGTRPHLTDLTEVVDH